MPATIEVDVRGRWDAIALMRRLASYHSYLIQLAPDRWRVHAEAPGCHGEALPIALVAIEESLDARHVVGAAVRVDGRPSVRATQGVDVARRWGGRPIGHTVPGGHPAGRHETR
jgi:hypothetical protein